MTRFLEMGANDTQDFLSLFQFINNASNGAFFPIVLVLIWVIAFLGGLADNRSASTSWVFASFLSIILGSVMTMMGVLSSTYLLFLILLLVFGIGWSKFNSSPS